MKFRIELRVSTRRRLLSQDFNTSYLFFLNLLAPYCCQKRFHIPIFKSNIIQHCLHVSYLRHEDEVHHGGVGHHAAGRLQAREDDAGVAEVFLAPRQVVTGHLDIELPTNLCEIHSARPRSRIFLGETVKHREGSLTALPGTPRLGTGRGTPRCSVGRSWPPPGAPCTCSGSS